jgi:hypothetical protein
MAATTLNSVSLTSSVALDCAALAQLSDEIRATKIIVRRVALSRAS